MNLIDENIYLNIADFIIKVNLHQTEWILLKQKLIQEITSFLSGFIMDKLPSKVDFTINFIQKNIIELWIQKKEKKNLITLYEDKNKKEIITFYQIGILNFLLILKKILIFDLLLMNDGFLLHSSAINYHDKAIIFLGKEGSGKSTAVNLLKSQYTPLADDISIIRKLKNTYYFFQTPFLEKEHVVKNSQKYVIKRIFLLRKSNNNIIEKITQHENILPIIMTQIYNNKKSFKKIFQIANDFMANNDLYYLFFNKDKEQLRGIFENLLL